MSIIKYSKPSIAVIKNKTSFFEENDKHLQYVREVNNIYLKQPLREKCKTCGTDVGAVDLKVHGVPYNVCRNCGHLNGLHQDTEEFANYLYSQSDGENYSTNYKNNYMARVNDIYLPKVEFLQEVLRQENKTQFNVTDLGCGGGHFVKACELRGINAKGFDTNKQLIDLGNEILEQNQIFYELSKSKNENWKESQYLAEIGWREFGYYLMFHFPKTINEPLRNEFKKFPWIENDFLFDSWKNGTTGYPLVDAGMRELWETGWMHNRVRMVVASFLVKHLLIDWKKGADWFWDTLVDADLASNTLGWQWSAGCGADAAPYFRIFNPTTQAEKFDGNGDYIRRWVPELKNMEAPKIFEPHKYKGDLFLKNSYSDPIVDHAESRKKALLAYDIIKK